MNRGGRSFAKCPKGGAKKSEKSKAFKDIAKYFPQEEWAMLGYTQKTAYVYMKKNYDTMTRLDEPPQGASLGQQRKRPKKVIRKKPAKKENDLKGVPGTRGSEQAQRQLCPTGKASTTGKKNKKTGRKKKGKNAWTYRLRERKNQIAYEEISDPEEEEEEEEEDD
ncbi:protein SSX7-like [Lemur catta]|uniref:protein SSX7-like n=1 Tax=Lemur catta TaxID=9447 RepID=UPI001E26A4C6|nr:protein SSX7-like [Lemur catta]